MELTNLEVAAVQKTIAEVTEEHLNELRELQLALVGGGIADPIAF